MLHHPRDFANPLGFIFIGAQAAGVKVMSIVAWMLGALFIAATACLAVGSRNDSDIDDALISATAGTVGGMALAADLTGWLIYLAV